MAISLTLNPVTGQATFTGLEDYVETVAIPIANLTAINNALQSLDTRLDTVEAATPTTQTYTVTFQPNP